MNVKSLGDGWILNWDGDSLELMEGHDLVAWINMSLDDLHFNRQFRGSVDMKHVEALMEEYKDNSRRHL